MTSRRDFLSATVGAAGACSIASLVATNRKASILAGGHKVYKVDGRFHFDPPIDLPAKVTFKFDYRKERL